MILNEKEKNLIEKYGRFDNVCEEFVNVYFKDSYDEELSIICSLIKKALLEELKDNNIEVDENIKFDIDEVLNNVASDEKVKLPNFDIKYLKDFDLLNNYFNNIIGNKTTSEEINNLKTKLSFLNFRPFLASYIPDILDNMNKQSYRFIEINNNDEEIGDYVFSGFEVDNSNTEINNSNNEEYIDDDFSSFDEFEFPKLEVSESDNKVEDKKITNEELIEYVKFINTIPELMNCRINYEKELQILQLKYQKKKLEEFYSNEDFMNDFTNIMEHDIKSHRYWFHGTQSLEDAYSISEQGLGLMRNDISSTAYPEFTMDEVILYQRGFGGEIGSDAVVIIDMPIIDNKSQNIVEELTDNTQINFSQSGLQGLNGIANYLIDKKYIVGFVDKLNKNIIFNPNYYNYEQFDIQNSSIKNR